MPTELEITVVFILRFLTAYGTLISSTSNLQSFRLIADDFILFQQPSRSGLRL